MSGWIYLLYRLGFRLPFDTIGNVIEPIAQIHWVCRTARRLQERAEAQRGIFGRHCRRKKLARLRVLRRQLLYAVGRELSDANAWPNWSQDSEFRAVRDRSAARRG